MTQRRFHPHFDDHGTLDWHTRYADAMAQAKRENKTLFIEMGRELCSQCRTLVQSTVPRPDVAPLLQQHFVALASDADEPEDEVLKHGYEMEDASMLPIVMFVSTDGKLIEGLSGSVNPISFASRLKRIAGVV